MVRKLPNFVPSLFENLMNFLLDIEDDPDWHKVREGYMKGGLVCSFSAATSRKQLSDHLV
jgi:hypothetical protein